MYLYWPNKIKLTNCNNIDTAGVFKGVPVTVENSAVSLNAVSPIVASRLGTSTIVGEVNCLVTHAYGYGAGLQFRTYKAGYGLFDAFDIKDNGDAELHGNLTASNLNYKNDKLPICIKSIDSVEMTLFDKYDVGYSEGFVVDTIIATTFCRAGSPNIRFVLHYGPDKSVSGTSVVTAGNTVTSYTIATKISSLNNATISAGNMIWLTFSDLSIKPKTFSVTIIGHRL